MKINSENLSEAGRIMQYLSQFPDCNDITCNKNVAKYLTSQHSVFSQGLLCKLIVKELDNNNYNVYIVRK